MEILGGKHMKFNKKIILILASILILGIGAIYINFNSSSSEKIIEQFLKEKSNLYKEKQEIIHVFDAAIDSRDIESVEESLDPILKDIRSLLTEKEFERLIANSYLIDDNLLKENYTGAKIENIKYEKISENEERTIYQVKYTEKLYYKDELKLEQDHKDEFTLQDDKGKWIISHIEYDFNNYAQLESSASTADTENLMSDTANELGITHENYPIIDGSTSTLSIVRAIHMAMYQDNEDYPTEASKTVPSYELLIDKEVDMIIVPYASSQVLQLAKDSAVILEFTPIAAEALVFITPIENKAENITMEQVREIYVNYGLGNWSELGGPDREIVPICRNSDSGSQSQMDNLILKGETMHPDINKNYVELTMEGMLEQVAFYHDGGLDGQPTKSYAIGYTLYNYLKGMGEMTGIDEHLKMLAFEDIQPSEETLTDGSYTLADGYYAVVASDLPKDHSARRVIDWLKSDDGKNSMKSMGFIPKE